MSIYSVSQLMRANLNLVLGASAQLGNNPASTSNDVQEQICRTSGEATLANFFVAPRSSMLYTSLLASRNSHKVASSVTKSK